MISSSPRQLTLRAAALGVFLGIPLAATNVYVGLKTGWIFGVALTAGLLAQLLGRARLSLLELNCAQSIASSAGFTTGNALVGAIPATMLLLPAHVLSRPALVAWISLCAFFGIALSWLLFPPLARQASLPFPSATAAASMLSTLSRDVAETRGRVRALLVALLASASVTLAREAEPMRGRALALDPSPLLLAAGALIGLRTCAWLVAGGIIGAYALHERELGVWLGAPLIVTYGTLVALARLRVRTTAARRESEATSTSRGERRWVAAGLLTSGAMLAALGQQIFGVPLLLSVLALLLAAVFAVVSCRSVAETDVTPGGALSKLTQLATAAVWPQLPVATVMTGALTHAVASASADCVNDSKCGQLLGASAKQQFWAQALGVVPGAIAAVAAYALLVPDARSLSGPAALPAPAAHQLEVVARVMQYGLESLSVEAQRCLLLGALLGVMLFALEAMFEPKHTRFLPSAFGLGLGLFLPVSGSLTMLGGAGLGAWASRRASLADLRVPVAAGAMLGESVFGLLVTVAKAL